MDKYKEVRVIGRGNYGTAHLVKDLQTSRKLVIKKIPLVALSDKEKKEAGSEISLLSRLSHPNIIQYVTHFVEDDVLHIVTSFCNGGDLSQFIKARKEDKELIEEDLILDIFIQLAMAVDYCHSLRVMHRDLKTSNVFITRKNVVKLGDFGIAKVLDSEMKEARTVVGTPVYMSPEVCENKPYDFKSDVWAMGCILYELCALEHAFGASNLLAVVQKIVQEEPLPIPSIYSEELKQLISSLLAKDPKDRPTVKKIFQMPFIRQRLEALAQSTVLPELDHIGEIDIITTTATMTTSSITKGHRRADSSSLVLIGKSKSLELNSSSNNNNNATATPPLPKIRRSSSSTLSNLGSEVLVTPPNSSPPAINATTSRRESPPIKPRHHSRSRSSIVVRAPDEEFASSPPILFNARERLDSEEIDMNDERLVMEELKYRSEGVERTSTELLLSSGGRRSHTRSNSTIGTVGRISGASSGRHSRAGSSVTALSLDT